VAMRRIPEDNNEEDLEADEKVKSRLYVRFPADYRSRVAIFNSPLRLFYACTELTLH
jgi:hypothetical protein